MGRLFRRVLLAALILGGGCWSVAGAADWAIVSGGADGDEYDMDLASVSRTGAFVHTWVREIHAKPRIDPVTHKTFIKEVATWDNDCTSRRYLLGEQLHFDAQGKLVGRDPARPNWAEVIPDSVADGVLKVACRATEPFPVKPLLDDIFAGNWVDLGVAPDGKRRLWLKVDQVVKLDADDVLFITRGQSASFEVIDGFAIKYNVSAYVVNCRTPKAAFFAADAYWTPTARAIAERVPDNQIVMAPIPPNSYTARYYRQICSAAVPLPKDTPDQDAEDATAQKVGIGTAWVGNKGYLITASHVIANGKGIEVYLDGEPVGDAQVVVDDSVNDIAILKLRPTRRRPLRALEIGAHGVALGRSVFTLGYPAPDVLGQQIKMTAGQVSSTAGPEDDTRFLQISVPVQPGNSGGPIIAWDGSVVGVADAVVRKLGDDPNEPPPQNVNLAIKAAYVRAMLEDLPDLGGYTYVKATADHDALVAAARKAVFMLVVTQ